MVKYSMRAERKTSWKNHFALWLEKKVNDWSVPPQPIQTPGANKKIQKGLLVAGGLGLATITATELTGLRDWVIPTAPLTPRPVASLTELPDPEANDIILPPGGKTSYFNYFFKAPAAQEITIKVSQAAIRELRKEIKKGFHIPRERPIVTIMQEYYAPEQKGRFSINDPRHQDIKNLVSNIQISNFGTRPKEVLEIGFDISQVLAEIYRPEYDNNRLQEELGNKLSLMWAQMIRAYVRDIYREAGFSQYLTTEEALWIMSLKPIEVVELNGHYVNSSLARERPKKAQPTEVIFPVVMSEKSSASVDETILYNGTPGVDLGVNTSSWQQLNKHPELRVYVPLPHRIIVAILPVTDNPEEIERAKKEFTRDKAHLLLAEHYPGQNIIPTVEVIPMYKIIKDAFAHNLPKGDNPIQESFMSIELTQAFFTARRKVLTQAGTIAAIDRNDRPFGVYKIEGETIEAALRSYGLR